MRDKTLFQINIALGFGMWGIAVGQSLTNWNAVDQIYLLILFGVAILVPLALYITRDTPIGVGYLARLPQVVLYFQPLVTIATGLSILDKDTFGILGAAWFIQSGLIALIGMARWFPQPFTTLEEIVLNLGFMYTATSGIWFFISRTSGSFMGFSGIIVPLTAAHFVVISMGALINIGMLGRHIHQQVPQYYRWYRIGASGAVISPPLVAVGITLTEFMDGVSPIEVLAVILLASSFVWLAGLYLLFIRSTITHTLTRNLLTLAHLTLFLTMALALGYSIGRFTEWWLLTIADMVRWHAWFNALGFAGLSVLAWSLATPSAYLPPPEIPFSKLPWRWKIGVDFLERINAIDQNSMATGIVDDLSRYASETCKIEELDPLIHNFYTQTGEQSLEIYPQWQPLFRLPAQLYKRLAHAVGQMNLPLFYEVDKRQVHSQIVGIQDFLDGRTNVRGWIRSYVHTQEPIYIAAYAEHTTNGRHYMNIAFPLPLGNLTSILALETFKSGTQTALRLSSIGSIKKPGEQGVYFVTKFLPVRLPINETIEVFSTTPDDLPSELLGKDAQIFARHQMWIFGLHFLTLYYAISSNPT